MLNFNPQHSSGLTAIILAILAFAASSSRAQPGEIEVPFSAPPPGYQGRAATYSYDDGTAEIASYLGNTVYFAFLSRFQQVAGGERILRIRTTWGGPLITNGMPARVFVWEDPNDDGNPNDLVLLSTQATTVQGVSTNVFSDVELSIPATVSGVFFIGATVDALGGAGLKDTSSPGATNAHTFLMMNATGPISASMPQSNTVAPSVSAAFPGFWLLRAVAEPAGITYQGKLTMAGQPVLTPPNLRFALYDSVTGGSQVGLTHEALGVPVENGVFTVKLPYGRHEFSGGLPRWLSVKVASDGNPYQLLEPRQLITPAPRAYAAEVADAAHSVPWSGLTGAVSVPWTGITGVPASVSGAFSPWVAGTDSAINYAGGAVGLGTGSPFRRLHVTGEGGTSVNGMRVTHGATGVNWDILVGGSGNSFPGGFAIAREGSALSGLVITAADKVGIGTASPTQRLSVDPGGAGGIIIGGPDPSNGSRTCLWMSVSSLSGGYSSIQSISSSGNSYGNLILNPATGLVGIGTSSPSSTLSVNGSASKPGGGSWSVFSDARLKHDITPLEGSLDRLLALRGVSFIYDDPAAINELPGKRIGMVAQDVERVFPDWVQTGPSGYKSLTFRGFEALAVEAMRELRAQNAELRVQSADLQARLERLEQALKR